MLQQILKDMYIEPELLAELDETQKQTLFCRMREEQVRRWRIWDQQEMEKIKTKPPTPNSSCRRSKCVRWLLADDGEPLVEVINDHAQNVLDTSEPSAVISTITEEESIYSEICPRDDNSLVKNLEYTQVSQNGYTTLNEVLSKENNGENGAPSPSSPYKEADESCALKSNEADTHPRNKPYTRNRITSVTVRNSDKRGALQEISMNKVQNVAKRVAEWEQRVTERGTTSPLTSSPIASKVQTHSSKDDKEKIMVATRAVEEEEDKLWREQQRKAKEVEIRIRSIARKAREEHRRSLIEQNNDVAEKCKPSSDNYSEVTIMNRVAVLPDMRKPPPDRDAVIHWFRTREVLRGAGYDSNCNTPAIWFHGLISRQEAESYLEDTSVGTFLVRISEKIWGYTVSYKDVAACKHYLVDASNGHYRFLGAETLHTTLNDLIAYHAVKPITVTGGELLRIPCQSPRDISDMFKR